MNRRLLILSVCTLIFAVDYDSEIQPIFDNHCGNCHLGNSSGGLNLSNYDNLMSSDVVVPGSHIQSELYDRITRPESDQGDMPPSGSLSQEDIDLIAQWIDEGALSEEPNDISGCMDPNAITCDDEIDPIYFPECDTCSDDDPCDNYYNPNATVDNGLCMYNEVPESHEFTINVEDTGLYLDWSDFTPPVSVSQYVLMRCLDADGDTDGDGYLEYENCYFIVNPSVNYQDTQFLDEFDSEFVYNLDETAGIKYTLSLFYPNNNYWGSAFGNYYYEPSSILMGDLNFDGIINVIDVVSLVNGILGGGLTDDQQLVADLNGDGTINVIDIVSLVNMILG